MVSNAFLDESWSFLRYWNLDSGGNRDYTLVYGFGFFLDDSNMYFMTFYGFFYFELGTLKDLQKRIFMFFIWLKVIK